jgi:hypothetical protein
MIVLATVVTIWTILLVLVVGACRSARLGDRAQEEPLLPSASHPPAPHVIARRHTVGLRGALRSQRKLPMS